MNIKEVIEKQKKYFDSMITRDYKFRYNSLTKLKQAIERYQKEFEEALFKDLGKSAVESYFAEIGITLKEITHMQKNLKKYMKNKRVRTSIMDFPAKSFISPHPYGNTLVMSPWNYPVMLALCPLVGAIAAGNTCVLKPSDYSHNTSVVIANMIASIFPEDYIAVVLGGREENQTLLNQKFDYIFFTGGKTVGKIVMEKAAKHLTPVTLELGGKSPCIIDETASIEVAARRIIFGKFLNAGQTCVAPDYIFVHKKVKSKFIEHARQMIINTFGDKPLESDLLGKIINEKHFLRLKELIKDQVIIIGGETNIEKQKISPTIIDNITFNNKIMQEEIFGPILPVLEFDDIADVYGYINENEKPLALYYFSNDKQKEKDILLNCNFGGGCINDTVVHVASDSLPFGGVGESGMGSYHGKQSFITFTHYRSILRKANWLDIKFRYSPYTKFKEKIIRLFLR